MFKKIDVTMGNINNGHFYIPRDYSFINEKYWGGSNSLASGEAVKLKFYGTGEEVDTDLDETKRIFRKARGQIRRFFEKNKITQPTTIFIQKIAENAFLITPNVLPEIEEKEIEL